MASNSPPNPMTARAAEASGATVASPRAPLGGAVDSRPDAVLEEIRAHLGEGRYRSAQRLAKQAAARFPEQAAIQRMNRGLNEWTVRARPASGQGRSEEFEWLRKPPESARGKWVALVGGKMVAAGESLADVMQLLKSMDLPRTPLVHRVD